MTCKQANLTVGVLLGWFNIQLTKHIAADMLADVRRAIAAIDALTGTTLCERMNSGTTRHDIGCQTALTPIKLLRLQYDLPIIGI